MRALGRGERGQEVGVAGVGVSGVDLAQGPRRGALYELAGVFEKFDEQGRGGGERETAERLDGGLADEHFVGLRGGFELAEPRRRRGVPRWNRARSSRRSGEAESDSGGEASQPLARAASGK